MPASTEEYNLLTESWGFTLKDGSGKQKAVGTLVMVGGGLVIAGVMMAVISMMIWLPFGLVAGSILVPLGIVLIVAGLASGWGEAFGDPSKKPVRRETNVYIVAKIIADKKAEIVIDPEFYDAEELRHLVQIEFQNGRKVEFETAPQVYDDIGEGMNGDIVYQGKWLNQFTFRPRAGAEDVGEDPFGAGKF